MTPETVAILNGAAREYQKARYIQFDPISIPHGFDDQRDIEIIGLFAALLAWGRRDVTISKLQDLCARMSYSPFQFIRLFDDARSQKLVGFKHRTFTSNDAIFLSRNLSTLYREYGTIENLVSTAMTSAAPTIEPAIERLATYLSVQEATPVRLSKHLSRPSRNSACKRLCMYFRWMTRKGPFDFGIWKGISTAQLVMPLDVHTGRQARRLGMLERKANDWKAALRLTDVCRLVDPKDPVRLDFALFGLGAYESPA